MFLLNLSVVQIMDYGFLEELRISRLKFGVKYSSELRTSEPRSRCSTTEIFTVLCIAKVYCRDLT